MNRETAKEILGEGATEEQITRFLNSYHNSEKQKSTEIDELKKKLEQFSDYDAIKNQLDEINKANMTEQQKLDEMKKETEKNLKESKIIVNTAKAKEILSGLNLSDDIINSLVRDDESLTVANATALKTQIETMREETIKQTKEEIANLDVKPNISNVNQNNDEMTDEKFLDMSAEEQEKYLSEHPDF